MGHLEPDTKLCSCPGNPRKSKGSHEMAHVLGIHGTSLDVPGNPRNSSDWGHGTICYSWFLPRAFWDVQGNPRYTWDILGHTRKTSQYTKTPQDSLWQSWTFVSPEPMTTMFLMGAGVGHTLTKAPSFAQLWQQRNKSIADPSGGPSTRTTLHRRLISFTTSSTLSWVAPV